MHSTLVHVLVKPGTEKAFLEESLKNRVGTLAEPGNVRFDILQDTENPRRFYLYEVFVAESDAKAHKETMHYLVWREAVADFMAEPRNGQPLVFHGD